jgi:hypothetical protein
MNQLSQHGHENEGQLDTRRQLRANKKGTASEVYPDDKSDSLALFMEKVKS